MKVIQKLLGWVLLVVASLIPAGLCLIRGWHKEEITITYAVVVVLVVITWYARLLVFRKKAG